MYSQSHSHRSIFYVLMLVFGASVRSLRLPGRNVARLSSKLTMSSTSGTDTVRVRFAPSPTGSLHVGGARTALYNWLYAKKLGGKFLIRVEDTDEARSTQESERSILSDLRWMNLNWDEGPEVDGPYGPYRQSERKDIYKAAADKLIAEDKAYPCFCTDQELDEKRQKAEAAGEDPKYDGTWRDADPAVVQQKLANGDPYTVRFKVPAGKVVTIDDKVRGTVSWDADASLGDFIIMRSNGMPVYNFCVSVDDAYMKITHVVRAEEHLTNTLRQMLILEALNYEPPTYAHCSLILGSDRTKMSKRHGATSVQQFSEQGFIPNAMMNYLAMLGWSDGTDKEIYTPEELIQAFDLSRIVKSPAVFDMDKLTWVNAQHLRGMAFEQVQPIVLERLTKTDEPLLDAACLNADTPKHENFDKFLDIATKIAQRDMDLTTDANRLVGYCLKYDIAATVAEDSHVMEVLDNDAFPTVVATLVSDFESGAMPTGLEADFATLWKAYMKDIGKRLGLKGKNLFHPVRLCLTGRMSGSDVGDQVQLLALANSGVALKAYPLVPLQARINQLKSMDLAALKTKAIKADAVSQ